MTTILLADDHPMIRTAIEVLLRDTDFEIVGTAGTGDEAFSLLGQLRPEILLLDLHMPGGSGMEVIRRLQSAGDAPPIVVDLALSQVARGKILTAAQKGEPVPADWAVDQHGKPTTDAKAALKGALQPIGGAKGAALALMVEVLAVALTGANFGFEASSFFDAEGPPPGVGQLILAIVHWLAVHG